MQKYYAPAISVFLAVCILFSGCSALIQPGKDDLAGASYFICKEPVSLTVSLEAVNGDCIMYYESSVDAYGQIAEWVGTATVYYRDTYFVQQCKSLTDGIASVKQWRGAWVETDRTSPVGQIQRWLQDMLSSGSYDTRPVIPAEESRLLAGASEAAFSVTLYGREVDWQSLCDADFDSLFGGDALLEDFKETNVTLYFHAETMALTAIRLEQNINGIWLSGGIVIKPTAESPDVCLSELRITEGVLSEDWSMKRFDFLEEGTTATTEP